MMQYATDDVTSGGHKEYLSYPPFLNFAEEESWKSGTGSPLFLLPFSQTAASLLEQELAAAAAASCPANAVLLITPHLSLRHLLHSSCLF